MKHNQFIDLNLLFNKFYKNIFSAIVYAVHFGLKNCKKPSDTSSIGRLVDVEFWAYRWAPAFKINSNELIQIVSENQNLYNLVFQKTVHFAMLFVILWLAKINGRVL